MGCGKTIGMLAVIADAKARGYSGKTLIVAPKSILHTAWMRDAENFASLKCLVCWSESKPKRLGLIESDCDVLITNFEQFKSHVEDFIRVGVRRLVIDEASKIKSNKAIGGESQITLAAVRFAEKCDSVYLLSGTPAPNTELEYFSLARCIDPSLWGWNSYQFANRYFFPLKRMIRQNGKMREVVTGWKMKDARREDFFNDLKSVWWSLQAKDCLDLPDESDDIREIELTKEEKHAYATILNELKVELADGRDVDFTTNGKLMKLRQVTGGMVIADGRAESIGDGKIKALLELIEEIGHAQIVVWAQFRHEIAAIVESLRDVGIVTDYIHGDVSGDDRTKIVTAFQAGHIQALVAHPRAAGHGLTLTAARHDCWYSLGWIPEDHEQARKRIHRVGQKWPVIHHYLVAPGTVDVRILAVLKRKATAAEAVKALLGHRLALEVA